MTGSRRRLGRVNITGVLMVAAAAAAVYFGFMYLPVLMHKMTMGNIAREHATRMLVDFDDGKLREAIFLQAREETGIQIGMSELFIQRTTNPPGTSITIKWTEQIKHIWGKNHVIRMSVTETASPGGGKTMKNAT